MATENCRFVLEGFLVSRNRPDCVHLSCKIIFPETPIHGSSTSAIVSLVSAEVMTWNGEPVRTVSFLAHLYESAKQEVQVDLTRLDVSGSYYRAAFTTQTPSENS